MAVRSSRVFENALVLVSTVPYLAYLLSLSLTGDTPWLFGLSQFLLLVGVLDLAHVGSTLYLYFDPDIRSQAKKSAMPLIVLPLLLIFGIPTVVFGLLYANSPASQYLLLLLIVAILVWQAWHFGMQSYGVFRFCSMTARCPRRTPEQAKWEKTCIMTGTIAGMCAVYHALTPHSFLKHFDAIDYGLVDGFSQAVYGVGGVLSFSAFAAAVGYLATHRRLFTLNSAVLFLVGAGFFVPDYFSAFKEEANPYEMNSANNLVIIHGMQYMVFLSFHAIGRSRSVLAHELTLPQSRVVSYLTATGPVWALLFCTFMVGGVLLDYGVLVPIVKLLTGAFQATAGEIDYKLLAVGVVAGISSAHYLVDQRVWKLSRPGPRAWMMARYGYLLPSVQKAHAAS